MPFRFCAAAGNSTDALLPLVKCDGFQSGRNRLRSTSYIETKRFMLSTLAACRKTFELGRCGSGRERDRNGHRGGGSRT